MSGWTDRSRSLDRILFRRIISIDQRYREHGFSRNKLAKSLDELSLWQSSADDERRLVVSALLEAAQRPRLVVRVSLRVRLDIRLLLYAGRKGFEGRHD